MFSLDYIEKLIYDFYNSSDGHSAANKQLTYYQVSKESWDFSWMLLQPEKAIEVQYFGASCLHMKISKYWSELGDEDEKILNLRSKLLDTMCKYMCDGKLKIVQTKLCVALASYIIHSITKHWPSAIGDLIDNFQPHNLPNISPNKIVNTLINILNVIPEEFNTNFLSMGDRNRTRNALVSSVNPVFAVIHNILEQQPNNDLYDVKQLAIKCFSNWSQNLNTLIIEGDLYERNLILILNAMSDEELISYCSESLISIYSQHEIHKYPNTVLKFIVQIVKLEDLLNDAIKKQQSNIYSALYNLFIHIGETHSRLILDAILTKEEYRDSILKLITFVLQCSATDGYYPVDETCSEQAFNFWYTLQDDIISSDRDKVASYLTLFNPLYQTLMDTLIKKVQYPPDQIYEQDWTNEDKESFRCYRQDIGDTFMYGYNMLQNSMLSILINHFNVSILQLSNNLNNMHQIRNQTDKPWQHLEAVIFAFTSISENIDAMESIHIDNLFESLSQIPLAQISAPRLTASIMEMFGAYYNWIYNHPEFLPKVLTLLVLGLKSDHIAVVSSTMALKDITRECQTLILPYANQLLIACEECLRPDSNFKPKEKSRLMCTIGQVLSITPLDVTMNYLNIILPPLLAGLAIEPQQQDSLTSLSSFSQKNNILHHISMLTMLFTTLDPELKQSDPEDGGNELVCRLKRKQENRNNKIETPHPTLPIFREALPRLIQIATKYINEESVIEAFSDCLKKAMFNLLDHAKPLVIDILRVLHDVYTQSYQPSLLDVLKLIMILYWEDADLKPILNYFYKQLCNQTVNFCCQDAKQKSSLIEYFFTNARLIMKKIPEIYRTNSHQDNQDLQSMFNLASNALVLAEMPTVRSASRFLNEFIKRSVESNNENLLIIVNNEGQHLMNRIFVVIGGFHDSSKFSVEFMADLLLSLNQHHFDKYCRWLSVVFTEQENFPTDNISKEQRQNFSKLLIQEPKNKLKLKEILSGLTLALRGFNFNNAEFLPQF